MVEDGRSGESLKFLEKLWRGRARTGVGRVLDHRDADLQSLNQIKLAKLTSSGHATKLGSMAVYFPILTQLFQFCSSLLQPLNIFNFLSYSKSTKYQLFSQIMITQYFNPVKSSSREQSIKGA